MSLGIYDRLWELLEGGCTELDLLLAKYTTVGGLGNTFDQYVVALKKREQLEATLHDLEGKVTSLDEQVTFLSLYTSNPMANQLLQALRETTSLALLEVAAVVNKFRDS